MTCAGARDGFSLLTMLVSVGLAGGVLLVAANLIDGSNRREVRMRQQGVVITAHALRVQEAQGVAVRDALRAEIAANPALKDCFSTIGGTNCARPAFVDFRVIAVPAVPAETCVGLNGPCAGADQLQRTRITYAYACGANACQGAKIRVESSYLGQGTFVKDRLSWVEIPKARLEQSILYDFSCTAGGAVMTRMSVSDGRAYCDGVPANSCPALGRPHWLNNFARGTLAAPAPAANVCNAAPASLPTAGTEGYRSLSVWTAQPRDLNLMANPPPRTDYCQGTAYVEHTVGANIDNTGGSNIGFTPVAGKPWPCSIEVNIHLNVCSGSPRSGSMSCSSYGNNFEASGNTVCGGGTSLMDCSCSSTSVSCEVEDGHTGCWDADTNRFGCRFKP
jgi:hypothetical protein